MDSKKRSGNGSCAQVRGQPCEPVACDGNMEGERINWEDLSYRAVAVGGVPLEKTLYQVVIKQSGRKAEPLARRV